MEKKRVEALLRNAAECFEDDRSPFDHSELVKHKVTADECGTLSYQIGAIIKGYLNSPDEVRKQVLVAYAMDSIRNLKEEE
jgi:hypothetical protein